MKRAIMRFLACLGLIAPLPSQGFDTVCAYVGASYDSTGMFGVFDAPGEPIGTVTERGAAYWAMSMAREYRISWYPIAQAGATSGAMLEQGRRLADLLGGHRVHCLVIGPTGEMVRAPETVLRNISILITHAMARGIRVLAASYPPGERMGRGFLDYAETITDYRSWDEARALYDAMVRNLGAEVVDAWHDMTPRPDGLHPDQPSTERAARRISEAVVRMVGGT